MTITNDLLLSALRDPACAVGFSFRDWNAVLRRARVARVVARLAHLIEEQGVIDQIPDRVRDHFIAAHAEAAQHARIVRWEVNRIEHALTGIDTEVILLKGAAYVVTGLPPARGRLVSDVDIMVPKDRIDRVERALIEHGWGTMKLDNYDQRYYRTWMHELPPLRHEYRQAVLDLHHTILPPTGRLHPDPALLIEDAVPAGVGRFKVLSPTDMLLHSAAHMFQDGELSGSIRDLADMADLMKVGGEQAGFWDNLVDRAERLDLARPLFYALRFAERFLGAAVPENVTQQAARFGPSWPVRTLMDALVSRSVLPGDNDKRYDGSAPARTALYIRSHWLRMPPILLTKHLWQKSLNSWAAMSGKEQPEQAA